MTAWGIDISNHQAGADLSRAKAAGCAFVFAKATEGLTYTDDHFPGFRAQAAKIGLPFGAYHFARPQAGRTGAQEARHFLAVHRQAPGDLPPVLDLEDTKLGTAATIAFALDWLAAVRKATGVRPIVYTYTAFAQQHLGASTALAAYPLWLANYRSSPPPAPKPWSSWVAWQHTSSATVAGVPGACDRNIAAAGFPPQSEEDDMTPDQLDQLAQAVALKVLGYENTKVNGDRDLYQVISDGSLVRDTIQAPGRPKTGNVNWTAQSYLFETFAAVARTYNLLSSVAGKVGADVDEAALAQQLAAALAPQLKSLVADAVAAGGSPDQIAQAVVDKLGAALTTDKEPQQ